MASTYRSRPTSHCRPPTLTVLDWDPDLDKHERVGRPGEFYDQDANGDGSGASAAHKTLMGACSTTRTLPSRPDRTARTSREQRAWERQRERELELKREVEFERERAARRQRVREQQRADVAAARLRISSRPGDKPVQVLLDPAPVAASPAPTEARPPPPEVAAPAPPRSRHPRRPRSRHPRRPRSRPPRSQPRQSRPRQSRSRQFRHHPTDRDRRHRRGPRLPTTPHRRHRRGPSPPPNPRPPYSAPFPPGRPSRGRPIGSAAGAEPPTHLRSLDRTGHHDPGRRHVRLPADGIRTGAGRRLRARHQPHL